MSTRRRASHDPHAGTFAGFAALIAAMFDVLAEAHWQEVAAHNRYPFAEW